MLSDAKIKINQIFVNNESLDDDASDQIDGGLILELKDKISKDNQKQWMFLIVQQRWLETQIKYNIYSKT